MAAVGVLPASLLLAALIDARWGEPPDRWHPVRLMGRLFQRLERLAPRSPAAAFVYGLAVELAGLGVLAWAAREAERFVLGRTPWWLAVPLYAALLKPAFAVRALLEAGARVEQALRSGNLALARHLVGWHLVSRDVSRLHAAGVAQAAIESLAENLTDSVVAPLFWWWAGGLAGAWGYRLINTLDAMWGYHGRYEHLGKGPARLDDAAGWLPARLAALLLLAAGWLSGLDARRGWHVWRRDRSRTESPNAGNPMAAAAGLLGVRLEKEGQYVLHAEAREPGPADLARARRLVGAAAWAAVGLFALARAL